LSELIWVTVTRCTSSSKSQKPSLKGHNSKREILHSGGQSRRIYFDFYLEKT
jgi:hypothetical protein